MPPAPRIVHSDDVYRLATWQNVSIGEFAQDVDAMRMRLIGRAHSELAAAYPNGVVAFTVIRAGVPVASQGARDEAVRFMKELGGSLLRSALVIEDTSIMAQVLRTFVRGLNIVTRNTKLVLCKDIDEAVRSLAPLVVPSQPGADVRTELAAAVVQAREGYHPRPIRPIAER